MKNSHGNLENEILNVVWNFEETQNDPIISVNEVFAVMNESNSSRAYTTIKTVMDRLVEKRLLTRIKIGKKFCYNSTASREELAQKAIKKLAKQYFQNDIRSMMKAIEKECLQLVY